MKPLIVTQGDPTGIGPEIIIKASLDGRFEAVRPLVVAGDLHALRRAAAVFGVDTEAKALDDTEELATHRLRLGSRHLKVRALSALPEQSLVYGRPDDNCGQAMVDYIRWAGRCCLKGLAAAMVTAPINKAAIQRAGHAFPGHTEMLAHLCGVDKVVMMLAGQRLKVALVTTHLPLQQVSAALSRDEILQTVRITDAAFRRFYGLERPRLAVLSLNPHAGEQGRFGDEEGRLIAPAIKSARSEGIEASGPYSADTLFHFAAAGRYDAVVCMYHDQGLIPLKLLHFEDAVNVTLGLPIVRTSVDHGTAYDLAGSGQASVESLVAAVRMAEEMASKIRPGS